MRRAAVATCAMVMFLQTSGAPWIALQVYAWAEMLHDYAQQTGSLNQAISMTFDGEHACSKCEAVARSQPERDHQQKDRALLPEVKPISAQISQTARRLQAYRSNPTWAARLLVEVLPPRQIALDPATPPPRRTS